MCSLWDTPQWTFTPSLGACSWETRCQLHVLKSLQCVCHRIFQCKPGRDAAISPNRWSLEVALLVSVLDTEHFVPRFVHLEHTVSLEAQADKWGVLLCVVSASCFSSMISSGPWSGSLSSFNILASGIWVGLQWYLFSQGSCVPQWVVGEGASYCNFLGPSDGWGRCSLVCYTALWVCQKVMF